MTGHHLLPVCLVFLALCPRLASPQSLDPGPWPTLGHDNQRTSRSTLLGPSTPGTPTLLYDAGSPVNLRNITLTSDQKILLASCTAQIPSLDVNGTPLTSPWPYTLMSTAYPGSPETAWGLTVSVDGHIYVATHECPDIGGGVRTHFYSLKPSGVIEPNWPLPSRAMYWPPVIGSSGASAGTIFQMDEFNFISAYRPDGTSPWAVALAGFGQGPLALDASDNLYVGTDGNVYGGHSVYSFASSGTLRPGWPQDTGGASSPTAAAIDLANSAIYLSTGDTLDASLYAFNPDGSVRPGFPVTTGGSVSQYPLALARSGIVYDKTSAGLFAIKPDGTSPWPTPFTPAGDPSLSPGPVIDANDMVYVAFGDNVYSLAPDKSIRPGWPATVPNAGELAIGANGLLYVISGGQKLYKIGSGTPPDSDGDGVPDSNDACANTPAGVPVDASGCSCDQKTCDDRNPCNGTETCDTTTAQCKNGVPPSDLCAVPTCSSLCTGKLLTLQGRKVGAFTDHWLRYIASSVVPMLSHAYPDRGERLRVAAESTWWSVIHEQSLQLAGRDCGEPRARGKTPADSCPGINCKQDCAVPSPVTNPNLFSNCSRITSKPNNISGYCGNFHLYCKPLDLCDPDSCLATLGNAVCPWQVGIAAAQVPRHGTTANCSSDSLCKQRDASDEANIEQKVGMLFSEGTTVGDVLKQSVQEAGLDPATGIGQSILTSDAQCTVALAANGNDTRAPACQLRRSWLVHHPAVSVVVEDELIRSMCVHLPVDLSMDCPGSGCGATACADQKDVYNILDMLSPP